MSDNKLKKTPEQETKSINARVSKTGLVATREEIQDRVNKILQRTSSTSLQTANTTVAEVPTALPPKAMETMRLITNSLTASPPKPNNTKEEKTQQQVEPKGSPIKKPNLIDLADDPSEEKEETVEVKTQSKTNDLVTKKKDEEDEEKEKARAQSDTATQKKLTPSLLDVEAEGEDDDGGDDDDEGSKASDVDDNGNIVGLIAASDDEGDSNAMDVSDSSNTKKKIKKRERKEQKRIAKLIAQERDKEHELDRLIASKLEAGGRSKTAAIGIKSLVGSKAGGFKSALKSIHGKVINLNKLERKELAKMEASDEEEDGEEEAKESGEESSDGDGDDAKSSKSEGDGEEGEEGSVDLMDISNEEVVKPAPEKGTGKGKNKNKGTEPEDAREAEDLENIKKSLGKDQSSVKSEAPPTSSSLFTFSDKDFESDDAAATTITTNEKADNAAEEDDDESVENIIAPDGSSPSFDKTPKPSDRQIITVDHEVLCRETAADVYSIMFKDALMRKHFQNATMAEMLAYIKGLDVVVRSGPIAPGSSSKVAHQVNPQITQFAEKMRMDVGALLRRIIELTEDVNEPWAARLNVVLLIAAGKTDIVENLKAKRDITCAFSGVTIPKDNLFGMLLIHAPSIGGPFSFPFAPTLPSNMNWMRPSPKSKTVIDLAASPASKPELPPKQFAQVYQNQEEDPDIATMMMAVDDVPTSQPVPAPALHHPTPSSSSSTKTAAPTAEIEADEEDPMEVDEPKAEPVTDQPKTIWELVMSGKLRLHSRYAERLVPWINEIRKLANKGDQSVASRIDPNDTSTVAVSAPYFKGSGLPSVVGSYDAAKPNHPWIKESLCSVMQTFFMVYDPQGAKKISNDAVAVTIKGLPFAIYARPNELKMVQEVFKEVDVTIFVAIAEFVYQDGFLKDLETFQVGVATLRTMPIGRAMVEDHPLKALDSHDFFPSEKPGSVHTTRLRFFYRLLANLFVSKIVYFVNPKK